MSKSIVWLLSVLVTAFTAWNVLDFVSSESHGTTSYLAICLNIIAVAQMVKLIAQEMKRNGCKK